MNVSTFLAKIKSLVSEDYISAPLWNDAEFIGYLRQTLSEFSELTGLIDKTLISTLSGSSGETNTSDDFRQVYYVLYDQEQQDLAQLGDMDFIAGDWTTTTTGTTPTACTLFGIGDSMKIRFVPIPSGGVKYKDPQTAAYSVQCPGTTRYEITIADGAISVTPSASGDLPSPPIISDGESCYELCITTAGTGVSVSATSCPSTGCDVYHLTDTVTDMLYTLEVSSSAVATTRAMYGLLVQASLAGTTQEFENELGDNNYGVVVDAYSNTAGHELRLDGSYGICAYGLCATQNAMVWHKGNVCDTPLKQSVINLSDGFIPVITHGVLALAYGHENEGQDLDKAKLLRDIFLLECKSIKQLFQRK